MQSRPALVARVSSSRYSMGVSRTWAPALVTNAGRLCTHRFLLERVWGPGYGDESQYLRVYMANLRKKLDDPSAPQLLLTEPGMGYRFVVPGAG